MRIIKLICLLIGVFSLLGAGYLLFEKRSEYNKKTIEDWGIIILIILGGIGAIYISFE